MYIGIDGGGTGTRGILRDPAGKVLGEAEAGPGNALVVGMDRAYEAVATVWNRLQSRVDGGGVSGTVIGLAGVERPLLRAEWIRRLDHAVGDPYWLVGDYQLAWAALTHGRPGIIGVVGTGSVFFGENGSNTRRIGGYGWQIGDVGSGIRLGQLGVREALKAMEGIEGSTTLVDLVQQFFGTAHPADILSQWYDKGFEVQRVAQLASGILETANWDFVARRLVEAEAHGIVAHLKALSRALNWQDQWPIGLTGGLADRWMPWIERSWIPCGYRTAIQLVSDRPVMGAAWLAQHWKETCRRSDRGDHTEG